MTEVLRAFERGRVLNIAHAGATERTSPYTLEGLKAVRAAGIDGIELDVQVTRDGIPILFHDDAISTVARGAKVRQLSLREIQAAIAATHPTGAPIVRLEDALEIVRNMDLIVLDIKAHEVTPAVVRLLQAMGIVDRTLVSSFEYSTLRYLQRQSSGLLTGVTIGPSRFMRYPLQFLWTIFAMAFPLRAARIARARAVLCPSYRVTPRLVSEAHRQGIAVLVWKIAPGSDLAPLLASGADGLISDEPERLQATAGRK